MKKNLAKFLAIVMVVSVLAFSGIPVFAHDYDFDHNMGPSGTHSGTDCRVAVWQLEVYSTYATSSGHFITHRATGNIYCAIQVDYNWIDSTAANNNCVTQLGDGEYAEIYFDAISYSGGTCQYNQIGDGSTSGSNSQTSWSLAVSSSSASSSGSVASPYIGNVFCYTDVDDSVTHSSTVSGSNSIYTSGNGYAAGITFSNIRIPINYNYSESQSGYGYKSGQYQQAHWSLVVASYYVDSFGYLDDGYEGNVRCDIWLSNYTIHGYNTMLNSCHMYSTGDGNYSSVSFSPV